RREVATGRLVLPRARQERRDPDLPDPVDGRTLVHEARNVERVRARELDRIERLEAELLVGETRRVAVVDALPGVLLPACGRRLRIVLALLEPRLREAVVEDAAGEAGRAVDVGDDRERRERGEVRRLRAADEELADAGERDADHADLPVLHPRLRRDRLDDVVAVGGGRVVEQV